MESKWNVLSVIPFGWSKKAYREGWGWVKIRFRKYVWYPKRFVLRCACACVCVLFQNGSKPEFIYLYDGTIRCNALLYTYITCTTVCAVDVCKCGCVMARDENKIMFFMCNTKYHVNITIDYLNLIIFMMCSLMPSSTVMVLMTLEKQNIWFLR